MTTLSLARLRRLIEKLGLDLAHFSELDADFAQLHRLVVRQQQIDRLQQLIGEVETTIGHTVGWPRLVVELDDYDLEFVSTSGTSDALVAARKISPEDAQWLNLELRERLKHWWRAARARGLPGLRRRELSLAALNQAELTRFMAVPPPSVDGIFVRLIVLSITAEEGSLAAALADLVAELARHTSLKS